MVDEDVRDVTAGAKDQASLVWPAVLTVSPLVWHCTAAPVGPDSTATTGAPSRGSARTLTSVPHVMKPAATLWPPPSGVSLSGCASCGLAPSYGVPGSGRPVDAEGLPGCSRLTRTCRPPRGSGLLSTLESLRQRGVIPPSPIRGDAADGGVAEPGPAAETDIESSPDDAPRAHSGSHAPGESGAVTRRGEAGQPSLCAHATP